MRRLLKILLSALMMGIPYILFSQNISLELPREQWIEIKKGLEIGEENRQLVITLQKALDAAQDLRKNDQAKIVNLRQEVKNLDQQIALLEQNRKNTMQQNNIIREQLNAEKQKSFTLGAAGIAAAAAVLVIIIAN